MKHFIESQQLDKDIIAEIFASADHLEHHPSVQLKGKIMASIFYEPSTRTRLSFEAAMMKLGGRVLTTENAKEFSSAAKGETIEDTIRVINHYADFIVLRHYETGSAARAAAVSDIPIINAGDGTGQHPTQALLDLYTIKRELGRMDDLIVTFVGDMKNGRTVRSLCYLLGKFSGITVRFISPPQLAIGDDIKEYLNRHNVAIEELENWDGAMKDTDVLYQTRIQRERFENLDEYMQYKGRYILTTDQVNQMEDSAIIMHPLPRVDEIDIAVDSSPRAKYFQQAKYGVLARMGLLCYLMK